MGKKATAESAGSITDPSPTKKSTESVEASRNAFTDKVTRKGKEKSHKKKEPHQHDGSKRVGRDWEREEGKSVENCKEAAESGEKGEIKKRKSRDVETKVEKRKSRDVETKVEKENAKGEGVVKLKGKGEVDCKSMEKGNDVRAESDEGKKKEGGKGEEGVKQGGDLKSSSSTPATPVKKTHADKVRARPSTTRSMSDNSSSVGRRKNKEKKSRQSDPMRANKSMVMAENGKRDEEIAQLSLESSAGGVLYSAPHLLGSNQGSPKVSAPQNIKHRNDFHIFISINDKLKERQQSYEKYKYCTECGPEECDKYVWSIVEEACTICGCEPDVHFNDAATGKDKKGKKRRSSIKSSISMSAPSTPRGNSSLLSLSSSPGMGSAKYSPFPGIRLHDAGSPMPKSPRRKEGSENVVTPSPLREKLELGEENNGGSCEKAVVIERIEKQCGGESGAHQEKRKKQRDGKQDKKHKHNKTHEGECDNKQKDKVDEEGKNKTVNESEKEKDGARETVESAEKFTEEEMTKGEISMKESGGVKAEPEYDKGEIHIHEEEVEKNDKAKSEKKCPKNKEEKKMEREENPGKESEESEKHGEGSLSKKKKSKKSS